MQTLCEIRVAKEDTEDDDEPAYETRKFILLHFGLKFEIIAIDDDRQVPVNYSVCICQDCETGWLRTFVPEEVRIIGMNIKK